MMEVYLPQLDELIEMVEKLDKKLDTLALTAAAGPAVPPEAAEPEKPAPAKRARKSAAPAAPAATNTANGEDTEVEDEDALRARCEFEAKRVQRLIGISGMRAAIGRVAEGALHLDDVPANRLTAALTALQAL